MGCLQEEEEEEEEEEVHSTAVGGLVCRGFRSVIAIETAASSSSASSPSPSSPPPSSSLSERQHLPILVNRTSSSH